MVHSAHRLKQPINLFNIARAGLELLLEDRHQILDKLPELRADIAEVVASILKIEDSGPGMSVRALSEYICYISESSFREARSGGPNLRQINALKRTASPIVIDCDEGLRHGES